MFSPLSETVTKRKTASTPFQELSNPNKLPKYQKSKDSLSVLSDDITPFLYNLKSNVQQNNKYILKGTKLYNSKAITVEYETSFPTQLASNTGTTYLDSDTGFMSLIDSDSCYIWNFKTQSNRFSINLTSNQNIPFFVFVGVYEDNEKYKSKLDIGAIICTLTGSVFFWDRIKYAISPNQSPSPLILELLENEYIIEFKPSVDALEYIAITNFGTFFRLSVNLLNNERQIQLISSQSASSTGFASKAASMLSSITKKISNYTSSSHSPQAASSYNNYKYAKFIFPALPNIDNKSSTLTLISGTSIEVWSYLFENNKGTFIQLSNDNIVANIRNSYNKNVNIEEIIDVYHILATDCFLVLAKVITQNEIIDYTFSVVSGSANSHKNTINIFLNHPFNFSDAKCPPKLILSDDFTVVFIVFDTAIYAISNHSSFSTTSINKNQIQLNKVLFNQKYKISGYSKIFSQKNTYLMTLSLRNKAGILNFAFNRNFSNKTCIETNSEGFIKSFLCQVVSYNFLEYLNYIPNTPINFNFSDNIPNGKLNIIPIEDATKKVSNLIFTGKTKFFKFSLDIVTNLNERISLCHSLNKYLFSEQILSQLQNDSRMILLNNIEMLLSSLDLWQFIEFNNSQYSLENNYPIKLITETILDFSKSSDLTNNAKLSTENFFLNQNDQIEMIFYQIKLGYNKINQNRILNNKDIQILSQINCTFLALVSSPLAYRLEFGKSLYYIPDYFLFKGWWSKLFNCMDLLKLSMHLFNLSFSAIKTFNINFLSNTIPFEGKDVSELVKNLFASGLTLLQPGDEITDYCEILEKGLFEDIQLDNDLSHDNSEYSNIGPVASTKYTHKLKHAYDSIENQNISSKSKSVLNSVRQLGKDDKVDEYLYIDQLVLLAQICFIVCPNNGSEEYILMQGKLVDVLFKLVQVGKIGTAIKLAIKLEYYDFVIKLLLESDNFFSDNSWDLQTLLDTCVVKYGQKFTSPLLKNYSKSKKFYSLLTFSGDNSSNNSSDMNETRLEKIEALKNFYENPYDITDQARKYKWIYDLSVHDYKSAYNSIIDNVILDNNKDDNSLDTSINMLSIAKLVHLVKVKKPTKLQKSDKQTLSLSTVDSLLNMNKLILRLLSKLKQDFPSKKDTMAAFDVNTMCSRTTNSKFRREFKTIYNNYKYSTSKLANSNALDVFEFISIILYATFPEKNQRFIQSSTIALDKANSSQVTESLYKTSIADDDYKEESEFWGLSNKMILGLKLICGLEWLIYTPINPKNNEQLQNCNNEQYYQIDKNTVSKVKASMFALFWMNVYLLDDWKRINLLDERSLESILTSTSLYLILSELKQQKQNLLGTLLNPSGIESNFRSPYLTIEDLNEKKQINQQKSQRGAINTAQLRDNTTTHEFTIYDQTNILFDGYQDVFEHFIKLVEDSRLEEHVQMVLSII
ncbi:hypothetical protein BB561_002258 [Smittium simulii]|uniref:Uncharacterized protein n=1 Tax=Smittium simulii TaxID=133385 RepID=A0A2T9YRA7_9FUNG|nr:hypothetical protein BB561_002258 [Smittium simulii]